MLCCYWRELHFYGNPNNIVIILGLNNGQIEVKIKGYWHCQMLISSYNIQNLEFENLWSKMKH